ncbi:hypothetical protein [Corynebacterium doosanense]|uniref:hypothetical protein n=1 Tax=Corynebacterium doosanense TaxID=1121358 RepID=UPI00037DDB6D|nr:hypothetical protein [Corynebacterium doosanense]
MNRTIALIIVAVMALAVIGNVVLHGPNWVALIFIAIAGAAVAFSRNDQGEPEAA